MKPPENLKLIDEDFWIEKASLVLIYGTCQTPVGLPHQSLLTICKTKQTYNSAAEG